MSFEQTGISITMRSSYKNGNSNPAARGSLNHCEEGEQESFGLMSRRSKCHRAFTAAPPYLVISSLRRHDLKFCVDTREIKGALTFCKLALGRMTLRIMTLSRMTRNKLILCRMTLSGMTFCRMTLSRSNV